MIEYRQNDSVLPQVDTGSSGTADIPIVLGYQIKASDGLAGWAKATYRRRGLDLTVRISANSSVFDAADTHLAGDAVALTFVGSYRTASGWRFDLGMSEDIQEKASHDASFNVAVRHDF